MLRRRRFKQTSTLEERLAAEAKRIRELADHATPSERERLISKARQAETTAHLTEWINSPGLQPPKG
ncbi:hypothetical protein CO669_22990 [Bradyrhizobium sp. Y36]|uniref:hypothetical protein n=1 Tax=Bradyrhizobium sp. Y36 TaxID=2035447 RepID=UPI000BE95DA6|nr:hypothetical protein [Bradyrhizobium sp. Y36]PDT87748.1 hypothetical protein CO669_22990 [Bradyrhizobium sp. Y36]